MNHEYDYLPDHPTPPPSEPVDWRTVSAACLWLISVIGWCLWLAFLLIPTFYELHGADRYPVENNVMFTLTGLVLALGSSAAYQNRHIVRSTLFTLVILVLAFWF